MRYFGHCSAGALGSLPARPHNPRSPVRVQPGHQFKTMASAPPRRKLSAILMVDVSGFSRMMGRDEEGTTVLIREFHERTKGLVESHQGRVVDTAGDSVFGEFDSVVNAVRCAQAIQQAQATVNASRAPEERIETRIGAHLG